jgi:hypothetical protein
VLSDHPMNVTYMGHREVNVYGDVLYLVKLSISGPLLATTHDNKYLEGIVCELFVQKAECASESEEDLTRCAARRLEKLGCEIHYKARLAARTTQGAE